MIIGRLCKFQVYKLGLSENKFMVDNMGLSNCCEFGVP